MHRASARNNPQAPLAHHAQFSGARIHHPEPFEPYDITRLTASIEFSGGVASRPLSVTLAWGENRELHGNLDGYVAEWDWRVVPSGSLYGRGKLVAKDILDLGTPAPPGFTDFHRISHVDALTLGYLHDVASSHWGTIGVGGDATLYRTSENLQDPYGSPHSFHFFLRWHPTSSAPAHHH